MTDLLIFKILTFTLLSDRQPSVWFPKKFHRGISTATFTHVSHNHQPHHFRMGSFSQLLLEIMIIIRARSFLTHLRFIRSFFVSHSCEFLLCSINDEHILYNFLLLDHIGNA